MISTRNLISHVSEVPQHWIMEHYAGLPAPLEGKEVNIQSLFNSNDQKPSMFIFWSKKYKKYWFHDFSTGKSGDSIKLVQELYGVSFMKACDRICTEYSNYCNSNPVSVSIDHPRKGKYRVTGHTSRPWNVLDAGYWTPYNIGSDLLGSYLVKPLETYTMTNEHDPADCFSIWGEYIYGFFTLSGELYKIYRPKNPACKFIKILDHIQGMEQLKGKKCLVLASSLKDGLSLTSLMLDVDFVASDSESSLLPAELVHLFLKTYHGRVFALLDNDEAGIKAMVKYRRIYGIAPILLTLAKDLSDSVQGYGPEAVRNRIVPVLNRKMDECTNSAVKEVE